MLFRFTTPVKQIDAAEYWRYRHQAKDNTVQEMFDPDRSQPYLPTGRFLHRIKPLDINVHPDWYADADRSMMREGCITYWAEGRPELDWEFPHHENKFLLAAMSQFFLGCDDEEQVRRSDWLHGAPFYDFIRHPYYQVLVPVAATRQTLADFINAEADGADDEFYDFTAANPDFHRNSVWENYQTLRKRLKVVAPEGGSYVRYSG